MQTKNYSKIIVAFLLILLSKNQSSAQCSMSGIPLPTSGTVVGGVFDVNSPMIIMGNLDLIGCDIYVAPGVTISLPPGRTLNITGGTMFHTCNPHTGDLWGGIDVYPRSQLYMNGQSIIEDAEYAIHIMSNTVAANAPIVDIRDSRFEGNYIGIFVNPAFPATNFVNLSVVSTEFTSWHPLLNSINFSTVFTYPYAGIELNDMSASIGSVGAGQNHFHEIHNGIISHHSSLVVRESRFTDLYYDLALEPFGYLTSRGIYANGNSINHSLDVENSLPGYNFEECIKAIETVGIVVSINKNDILTCSKCIDVRKCPDNSKNYINDNEIENTIYSVYFGILSQSQGKVEFLEINRNTITVSDPALGEGQAIVVNEANDYRKIFVLDNRMTIYFNQHGIYMSGCKGISVRRNFIDQSNNLSGYYPQGGIYVNGCSENQITCNNVLGSSNFSTRDLDQHGYYFILSKKNTVACNVSTENSHGFHFDRNCDMPDLFSGNTMNNDFYGLVIDNNGSIGPQDFRGNIWNGPFGSTIDAMHTGTFTNSIFRVDNSWNPNYWPVNPSPGSGWFNLVGSHTTFLCESYVYCADPPKKSYRLADNMKNTDHSYIYPNPASNEFTLVLGSELKGTELRIYSSTMELIQIENINPSEDSRLINSDKLSPGLYMYHIIQDGKFVDAGKFSIVR